MPAFARLRSARFGQVFDLSLRLVSGALGPVFELSRVLCARLRLEPRVRVCASCYTVDRVWFTSSRVAKRSSQRVTITPSRVMNGACEGGRESTSEDQMKKARQGGLFKTLPAPTRQVV